METTAKVLETMRSAGKPVSAGEVATLSGLDRKEVDKASPSSRRTEPSYHLYAASGSRQSKIGFIEDRRGGRCGHRKRNQTSVLEIWSQGRHYKMGRLGVQLESSFFFYLQFRK